MSTIVLKLTHAPSDTRVEQALKVPDRCCAKLGTPTIFAAIAAS
jgi:hypothetical protein